MQKLRTLFWIWIPFLVITFQPTLAFAADGTEYSPTWSLIALGVGIFTVLGLIIGLRVNAFIALILAALVVSLMAGGAPGDRMNRVVASFGSSAGGIGIVIAMAAIIGKCMLDSGAADRIVRAFLNIFGPRQSGTALMGSGFLLAVPVFFDTVFYLLVPLARSLHLKTQKNYLKYLMAIATGGAITHTLVPPTPGPLLMGANLGVDVGMMMLIGAAVAAPAALIGLVFSGIVDRIMPIPMRPLGGKQDEPEPLSDDQLPTLWFSLAPVLLPVILISSGTVANTLADGEDRARLTAEDFEDLNGFVTLMRRDVQSERQTPAMRIEQSKKLRDEAKAIIFGTEAISTEQSSQVIDALNDVLLDREFHDEQAFLGIALSDETKGLLAKNRVRMKSTDVRRMNRLLLEDSYKDQVQEHEWNSPARKRANFLSLPSNPNFALIVSAIVAICLLGKVRKYSLKKLGGEIEEALLSGGMIILITAAGGAFGAMLQDAGVGEAVKSLFSEDQSVGGFKLLFLSFGVAAALKVAQGSSTVAMIVGSGIVGAIAVGQDIGYHPVYLGTAVGSGSLIGSWMNDSGFWVFTKMGGLTEAEGLKSWTLLLLVLGLAGLGMTMLLCYLMPMV